MECCDNRNGCVKMCMKLSELNGLSANDLLEKAGQADIVPVDVAQLCYDLQIIIKPFDFSPIENTEELKKTIMQKGNILGVVLAQDDDLAILYRQADSKNRKRFTIAHELAHCCLHMTPQEDIYIEFRMDEISSDQKEIDANIFAGELLIPENALRTIIGNQNVTNDFVVFLSDLFAVSVNVMKGRLEHLKINILSD